MAYCVLCVPKMVAHGPVFLSAPGLAVSGIAKMCWQKAGLEEPKNWQQLLDVAQKLNDPANKKYGIALPTAESVLTEQSFSQFALSNQANVFNAEGKITLDTPEMMQALTYYRDLAANTMPGSNDIMEVKDAFMNGTRADGDLLHLYPSGCD
ncbi:ABC transporter substrate-binding protein [Escherichia coli]|uniref:ABC transporter substrate-binding protein n=1 Tax=Escherichia coli TaxID=562 RepID=A0A376UBJ8_ECOLX|nr:ABC transporter substrate-binding protein [Escherichia coli]